jgi:hypothetical protein
VHWLITGEPHSRRLAVAARHDFGPETGQRAVLCLPRDETTLSDVAEPQLAERISARPCAVVDQNFPVSHGDQVLPG